MTAKVSCPSITLRMTSSWPARRFGKPKTRRSAISSSRSSGLRAGVIVGCIRVDRSRLYQARALDEQTHSARHVRSGSPILTTSDLLAGPFLLYGLVRGGIARSYALRVLCADRRYRLLPELLRA